MSSPSGFPSVQSHGHISWSILLDHCGSKSLWIKTSLRMKLSSILTLFRAKNSLNIKLAELDTLIDYRCLLLISTWIFTFSFWSMIYTLSTFIGLKLPLLVSNISSQTFPDSQPLWISFMGPLVHESPFGLLESESWIFKICHWLTIEVILDRWL